ncbi:MAG: DNA topoisomerase-1, partial [Alphaproteobacteria bacterium]
MILVIVESPAKAKTISKYLGSKYKVIASVGHVRDLPSKNDSVVPTNEFEMKWKTDPKKTKTINEINENLKNAEKLVLATDPDREGEAISWHILEILKKKKSLKDKPVERVVFNAVTKDSVLNAMKAPRGIDINLVEAYKTRLSLDYLVG